jgi:DNA invertase Pin-like site-specific DNA recombinase
MAIGKRVAAYLAARQVQQAEVVRRILRLREDGVPIKAIAKTARLSVQDVRQIVQAHATKSAQDVSDGQRPPTVIIVGDERRRLVDVDAERRRTTLVLEVCRRYVSGERLVEIADSLNLKTSAAYGLLKKSGIQLRRGRPASGGESCTTPIAVQVSPLPTEEDAIHLYQNGQTAEQVAGALQVTVGEVRRVINKHGISRGRGRQKQAAGERHFQIAEAYRSGKTMATIGREHGITRERVRQLLAKAQEPSRPAGAPHASERAQTAVELFRQGNSCAAVASVVGVSRKTVAKWLRASGLILRPGKAPNPVLRQRDEAMARLYRGGTRLIDIARTFGIPPHFVWNAIRRLGVQPRSRRRRTRSRQSKQSIT